MKSKLRERVNLMCNLSDLAEERGNVIGREEERKHSVRIMMEMLKDMGVTIESAIECIAEKCQMDIKEVYAIVSGDDLYV